MIAIDTDILVYSHREDSEFYVAAYRCIGSLAEGKVAWAIPWPCLHEFIAIATHPRIYLPPSPLPKALAQVEAWLEAPTVVLLTVTREHGPTLRGLLERGRVVGPQVHDARIAALCVQHGVRELWTVDRDFNRYAQLTAVDPFVRPAPRSQSCWSWRRQYE